MPRKDRAKQFAPFDALKGLRQALRMKEYEHDRIEKGDITEEKIEEISKTLTDIEKGDSVEVTYFYDGYYKTIKGKSKVDIHSQKLIFENITISFDDIIELKNYKKF